MRQDLIEKLRSGKAALLNNGDLEAINKILKKAFPKDEDVKGHEESFGYSKSFWSPEEWVHLDNKEDFDFSGDKWLNPEDFFTEKKENPYDIIDEAIKKAARMNKELRETLKLKKEIAEFDKVSDIKTSKVARILDLGEKEMRKLAGLYNTSPKSQSEVRKSQKFNIQMDEICMNIEKSIERIKQDAKPQLPKIGCQQGEELPSAIQYGGRTLSKYEAKRLEQLGISSLTIDGKYKVSEADLKQIYKVARNND